VGLFDDRLGVDPASWWLLLAEEPMAGLDRVGGGGTRHVGRVLSSAVLVGIDPNGTSW
jgi:hypothetical protein